jgi:hypothetical protein
MDERPAAQDGEPVGVADIEPGPSDPWASFDRWASRFCLVLGLLEALVTLLILGPATDASVPPLLGVGIVSIGVIQAGLMLAVAWGLRRLAPWGRHAAVWVLWLVVVTGVLGTVLDLVQSRLTIPVAAIAGALILSRKPGPLPAISQRDATLAAAIGIILLALLGLPPLISFAVTNPA